MSPNQYAFLAIIAHFVSNDGQLGVYILWSTYLYYILCLAEELLIDFRELIGEHSGENMVEAVWQTQQSM